MKHRIGEHRRGAAVVVALVALVVAGVVAAGMLRLAVERHRQLQAFERRAQTEWLLSSGLARARVRLSADPDYAGESWEPVVHEAVVTIRVERIADQPARRRIDAAARLNTRGSQTQRSRQIELDVGKPGDQQ